MFGSRQALSVVQGDDKPVAPPLQSGAPDGRARAVVQRLEWTVLRRLDGVLQGNYRTLLRGFGLDLADLREYMPTDDVRHIDWNVTARMQTPYVRQFQEDREVAAWFLVDLSASIDFGSTAVRKRDLAIDVVTVLAQVLARHGNRIGALVYADGRVQRVPARAGRRHLLYLVDNLLRASAASPATSAAPRRSRWWPRRRPVEPAATSTDLRLLLEQASAVVNRRSVMFLVSDFISEPGWTRSMALLARRHELVAIRVVDPLELRLPDLGLVVMQDAESGEQMFVDTRDRAFRQRFEQAAAEREALLADAFAEAGVDALDLATDESLDQSLLRFIKLRKARSQLGAGGVGRGRS